MKWGLHESLTAKDFWSSLSLAGEWVTGDFDQLMGEQLQGIFVNPETAMGIESKFKEVPRAVFECRFVDFIKTQKSHISPSSSMRLHGEEFFSLGTRILDSGKWAYITGYGPWSQLFAVLAVSKGFSQLRIVVESPDEAIPMIAHLKKFCFNVEIEALRFTDLTLQPNNGSLLVNSVDPGANLEFLEDLAYLNFLSPGALLIETHVSPPGALANPLLTEAKNSKLAVLDGETTQAFAEYHVLRDNLGVINGIGDFQQYQLRRRQFFATK